VRAGVRGAGGRARAAAQQLGIDAVAQVELLIAFRDVSNLPASWSLATPLAQWDGVTLSAQGSVTEIDLHRKQLTGHVDLTALPASLTTLCLSTNQLTGHVDLTKLPASLMTLWLDRNAGLTGVWRGEKPSDYDFSGTGITVA
jgi:hypothetical protein